MNYLTANPDTANLAICLLFVTGLRVGELVTLKHSDFDEFSLKVRRTETRYTDNTDKIIYESKSFQNLQRVSELFPFQPITLG